MISQLQVCVSKANSVFADGMRQKVMGNSCTADHNSKGKGLVNNLGGNIVATGLWCRAKTTPSWNKKRGHTDFMNAVPSIFENRRFRISENAAAFSNRTSHTNPSLPNQGGGAIFNLEAEA